MTVCKIDVPGGPRATRRWLKRMAARRRRRLWSRMGEDAPVRVTRGWWS